MISEKKAILFDMDGVLVDSEPQHYRAWNLVFREMGFEMPWEPYKPCIGSTFPNLVRIVEEYTGKKINDLEAMRRSNKEKLKQVEAEEGVAAVEGVRELMPRFKEKGWRMAVASSSPKEQIASTVKALGIEDCFELLFTGESVPNPKPAPDTFLRCAEAMGVRPEECIVIEDSYNGSLAARRAGMYCIGIQNPGSGDQDLSNADMVIKEFKELEGLLL